MMPDECAPSVDISIADADLDVSENDIITEEITCCQLYTVLVRTGTNRKRYLMGHVVTHLDIEDWCEFHGYRLLQCLSQREALPGEVTKLNNNPEPKDKAPITQRKHTDPSLKLEGWFFDALPQMFGAKSS